MSYQVYLIDDDARVLNAISTLLRLMNYDVRAFHDETEFLESIDSTSSGCAIIDYRLARRDGLQVVFELRARQSRIVPILISGHADESVREMAQ